jgi:hypothetical protein
MLGVDALTPAIVERVWGQDEVVVDNYLRISLDGESIAPPIRVVIYASKENPIKISRVKSGVAVDCFSVGWPRSEEL